MASQPTIDIDEMLAPLSGDEPGGEDLRWDPLYDDVKAARDPGDKASLEVGDSSGANWNRVINLCSEALITRTKDLMLGCYLTEALLEHHGFAGLRDGLKFITELMNQHWDHLYPQSDDGDLEIRAAPVVWISAEDRGAKLPASIRSVAMFPNSSSEDIVFSWSFWKSRHPRKQGEEESDESYRERVSEAEQAKEQFEQAAAGQSVAVLQNTFEDLEECLVALEEFGKVSDEKLSSESPSLGSLKGALDDVKLVIRRILRDRGMDPDQEAIDEEESSDDDAGTEEAGTPPTSGAPRPSGPIATRAEAYAKLREITSFLMRTEPHSPVSFLLARAVSWGDKTLDQILPELIKDVTALEQVGEFLGIQIREED